MYFGFQQRKKLEAGQYISEDALVLNLVKRDQKAFEYLYDNYSGSLYGVILRIVRHEEVANETLQDTFLKIWNKIDRFDHKRGKLFTWMVNIARNTAIDKLRSKEISQTQKTESFTSFVHKESEQIKEEVIGIKDLLNQLDKDQKLIMELIYFGGYTHAEVSEEYELPLGTVKTRVRNSLIALRKYLNVK